MTNKREFVNTITGDTQGCFADSELESALVRDPDWKRADSDPAGEGDGQPEHGSRKPGIPEELGSLKREQLNDIATRVGVKDPESLPNKDEVIDAIHKHADSLQERQEPVDPAGEGDGS